MNGTIYLSTDWSFCINKATSHIIVCASTDVNNNPGFIQATGAIVASVLVPPYEACMAKMNGDEVTFENLYASYLSVGEPCQIIGLLLKSMYLGKNIILYCSKDEFEVGYIQVFMKYVWANFGVCIGTEQNPFMFNPDPFNDMIISEFLFNIGIDDSLELFAFWKPVPHYILNDITVIKLSQELSLYLPNSTTDKYREFIRTMIFDNLTPPVRLA